MITFQFLDIFNNLFLSLPIHHSHNTIVFPHSFYHDSGINTPLFLFSFFVMYEPHCSCISVYPNSVSRTFNDKDYISHAHQVPWYLFPISGHIIFSFPFVFSRSFYSCSLPTLVCSTLVHSRFTSLLLFVIYSCFVTLILLFLVRYSVWLLSLLSFNHGVLFFSRFYIFLTSVIRTSPLQCLFERLRSVRELPYFRELPSVRTLQSS